MMARTSIGVIGTFSTKSIGVVPARTMRDVNSKSSPKSPQFCIIYHEEIGAMLDAMGFCMRRFTVGTGAQG